MKHTYKKMAVGGTFDKFHKGHEILIRTAFNMADEILIGVTSDEFVRNKNHETEPVGSRIDHVKTIIKDYENPYVIKEITGTMGTADRDPDLDSIVVSQETEQSAVDINKTRLTYGLKPLDIVVIEWILADDGVPISSTRIRRGEIDTKGNILY